MCIESNKFKLINYLLNKILNQIKEIGGIIIKKIKYLTDNICLI